MNRRCGRPRPQSSCTGGTTRLSRTNRTTIHRKIMENVALALLLTLPLLGLLAPQPAQAEKGILVVHVRDPKDRPISGVQIATEGDGATGAATDGAGKTRIRLAPQTQAGHRVT